MKRLFLTLVKTLNTQDKKIQSLNMSPSEKNGAPLPLMVYSQLITTIANQLLASSHNASPDSESRPAVDMVFIKTLYTHCFSRLNFLLNPLNSRDSTHMSVLLAERSSARERLERELPQLLNATSVIMKVLSCYFLSVYRSCCLGYLFLFLILDVLICVRMLVCCTGASGGEAASICGIFAPIMRYI